MKVILLKDVPKLGRKDDVKDVPQGHALNFLIPRKLVIAATPGALQQIEKRKKEQQTHKEIANELIKETFASIHGKIVVLGEKANEQGHLFSKVTIDHIVLATRQSTAVTLDASWITIDEPIKTTGEHGITLKHGDHKASFTLEVKAL